MGATKPPFGTDYNDTPPLPDNHDAATPPHPRDRPQATGMSAAIPLSGAELYRRLLRYVLPYRRTFAIAIASMVLLAATEPALPALLQPLLDGTFVARDPVARLTVPGLIVVLFVFRGAVAYAGDVAINWVAQKVVMDLRTEMFRRLVALPTRFYDDSTSGELISKITFDVAQVAQAATRGLTVLVKDALAVLGLLAYLLYLNWSLSITILLMAPVIGLAVRMAGRRLRVMSHKVQESMAAVTQIAQETIECQKTVKVFGGQDYELARFQTAVNRTRHYAMKVVNTSAANVPIVLVLVSIVLAIVTYLAASQSAAGELTVGEFVSFFTGMTLLLPPIKRITGINEHLQRGLAAAHSVFKLIDEEPEPDRGRIEIGRARGAITFRDVGLRYAHRHNHALSGVSLAIAAGETVALVGASGSGKSSLVNLIPRFYLPTEGRILLDGIDIADLTLASLRRNIALVSQDILLFNDSIRNNIAYGALRDVGTAEVLRAAEAAHVIDFVRDLQDGLETLVGENGVRLSGGQRQRLAIARAILKDAPVLILDEATSSLDAASERHIQEALETLRHGRTCIIIAHRLFTIETADRIVVLDQGRIDALGRHADLIRKEGVYATLYRIQSRERAAG